MEQHKCGKCGCEFDAGFEVCPKCGTICKAKAEKNEKEKKGSALFPAAVPAWQKSLFCFALLFVLVTAALIPMGFFDTVWKEPAAPEETPAGSEDVQKEPPDSGTGAGFVVPEPSKTPAPETPDPPAPETSNTPAPAHTNTPSPARPNYPAPVHTNTPVPSYSPVPTDPPSPTPSDSPVPADSPVPSDSPIPTDLPSPVTSDTPDPVTSGSPAPASPDLSAPPPSPTAPADTGSDVGGGTGGEPPVPIEPV